MSRVHNRTGLLKSCVLVLMVAFSNITANGQVTFERLLNSAKEAQNWLTYSGDYAGHRFSPLNQIMGISDCRNGKI